MEALVPIIIQVVSGMVGGGIAGGVLKQAAMEIRDILRDMPGTMAIEDDLPWGKQEIIMELTPAGQKCLQHARIILRQVDHLKNDFQEQAAGDSGNIRIFANTTAVTEFMPAILARFLAAHPGVTVDLQERLTRDIVRGVLDGSTDLGIVSGPIDAPELQTIHFSTDKLVLVAPQGHPLGGVARVKLTDAVQYPFITMHEGSTLVAFLRE